ncbi:endonuclease SmrB [Buchnera aphidicola (Taiwanaphis decaspermi)]|uniref:endonuclease SmrB n=1 Tax=Buchnera aphidicola TaxID=9 RepID=UPI0031B8444A
MKKKNINIKQNYNLFITTQRKTKKIVQDTIFHFHKRKKKNIKKENYEQELNNFYFSKNKSNILYQFDPICYFREDCDKKKIYKLKKGIYKPGIFLDLHGLTQKEARRELGYLFRICQKEKIFCANIMHGHGKNILKNSIPFWLSQHPDVIAFHRSPKIFGYNAALLVLIDFNI